MRKKLSLLILLVIIGAMTLTACGDNGNKEVFPAPSVNPNAGKLPDSTPGPVPGTVVKFPEDEAPHKDITEWWYYTGHVTTSDGQRYGIEYVIFQASRASYPVVYPAHFAIIDAQKASFKYEQDTVLDANAKFGGTTGFDLKVNNWTMKGLNGTDTLKAKMKDGSYAIDMTVKDIKGPSLHGGGQFTYGVAGSSYYYSRTRMQPTGTINVGGQDKQITGGTIWFDHQWGNFLATNGGWDWFSTQLDDNSELMIYNLRDASGKIVQAFGTYVPPCTSDCSPTKPTKVIDLNGSDSFSIKPTGEWVSPQTKVKYPSGWTINIKAQGEVPAMELNYKPVVPNAELVTEQSTGVIYWEGDTILTGTKGGQPITGSGYVELTGYDKVAR